MTPLCGEAKYRALSAVQTLLGRQGQTVTSELPVDSSGAAESQSAADLREALVFEMAPGRLTRARDDALFDRLLPHRYGRRSSNFWTPLAVAARIATWLDHLGIELVVDIGAGVGKFCVGAALASRSAFIGIEQRPDLVGIARDVARSFVLERRIKFLHGAFGEVTIPDAPCYYFFMRSDLTFQCALYLARLR